MKAYDDLKALVDGLAEDVVKADAGNKSAKTRIRKVMMDIKASAHSLRAGLLGKGEVDDAAPVAPAAPATPSATKPAVAPAKPAVAPAK